MGPPPGYGTTWLWVHLVMGPPGYGTTWLWDHLVMGPLDHYGFKLCIVAVSSPLTGLIMCIKTKLIFWKTLYTMQTYLQDQIHVHVLTVTTSYV